MKPDTLLTLGDFTFTRLEIPEQMPFGGEQALTVHQRVGGVRVIDAMGAAPAPLEWSGCFTGEHALERALTIDGLRKAGKPLPLSWSALSFNVIIQSFYCAFKRFYRLPYRIVCEVVEDQTAPVTAMTAPGIEQWIGDDMRAANGLAAHIGDGALSTLMDHLNNAIGAFRHFVTAAQSTLSTVLEPIAAVRAQIGLLLESTNGVIRNVTPLDGMLQDNPVAQRVNTLFSVTDALFQASRLIHLDRTLGRLHTHLGALHSGMKQITVAGGNLYRIAADEYGNAMDWTAIAQANGLLEPNIDGIQTLIIPPRAGSMGGVLHA